MIDSGTMARSSSINRSRPLKPTPAFSQDGFSDDDENGAILDEADSEEDEWDEERAGPSSSSNRFDQDEDSESEDDDDDGLALYESDQGEVIDDEDEDEEVNLSARCTPCPHSRRFLQLTLVISSSVLPKKTGSDRQT